MCSVYKWKRWTLGWSYFHFKMEINYRYNYFLREFMQGETSLSSSLCLRSGQVRSPAFHSGPTDLLRSHDTLLLGVTCCSGLPWGIPSSSLQSQSPLQKQQSPTFLQAHSGQALQDLDRMCISLSPMNFSMSLGHLGDIGGWWGGST